MELPLPSATAYLDSIVKTMQTKAEKEKVMNKKMTRILVRLSIAILLLVLATPAY